MAFSRLLVAKVIQSHKDCEYDKKELLNSEMKGVMPYAKRKSNKNAEC